MKLTGSPQHDDSCSNKSSQSFGNRASGFNLQAQLKDIHEYNIDAIDELTMLAEVSLYVHIHVARILRMVDEQNHFDDTLEKKL
jgi:hypothetical protein